MKQLNREKIQRMIDGRGSSGGSGGGGGSMAGYASQAWVDQNYISIEFFGRLFKAYHPSSTSGQPDEEVLPNDLDTTITNIKAMFGFWTEQYLSTLGQGSGGGGGGGATELNDLVDVTITSPTQGQVLTYDGNGHWVNGAAASGGISLTDMWNALATNDSTRQINISHLTSALNDYATQTWVSTNFLGANATAAAATKLATARTLWGQSFDGQANVSGNMTDVGDIQCTAGSRIHGNGGDLYIGNSSNAAWLKLQDVCSQSGDTYWKILATGNATFANVLSNGYVTALSDIRMKKVTGHVELKAETIADASAISFIRKDDPDQKERVGGIAQEWQNILPEAVVEIDKKLTMDYAAIDYVGMVSLARRVVRQQLEIDELKEKLHRLEEYIG